MKSNDRYLTELNNELEAEGYESEYVCACLEYAENLLNAGLPVIFDPKHFALLLGMDFKLLFIILRSDDVYRYRTIRIPKKHGGYREINMPSMNIKYMQRWILDNILNHMHFSEASLGFRQGTSIVRNAAKHLNKNCILSLDIKDFFPSITYEDVFSIFSYYGYTRELSNLFALICTYKGVLPQGAPSSPALSNLRCLRLDKRLSAYCEAMGATYTRYADDITISCNSNLARVVKYITEIIVSEGFIVNEEKTRIRYSHQRQEVTGLIVNNDKLSIPKEYKRNLKKEIYYCKKYGPYDHQKHIGDNHMFYKEHLYGKAYFVKMVEPELGESLLQQLDEIYCD